MDHNEPSLFNIGAPPAPALHLLQLATGHWAPQILRVFCRLGLADKLTHPKSSSQLAEESGALPDMLFRFLRTAEMVGVCKQAEGGKFELTEMGEYCKSEHPYSCRGYVLTETSAYHYLPWLKLEDVLMTGQSSVPMALGVNHAFELFQKDPERMEDFKGCMKFLTKCDMEGILMSRSFDDVEKLIDVGGGPGDLVMGLLRKYPKMNGVVADLPHVVESNPPVPDDLKTRCTSAGIDMFRDLEAVKGADGYVLKIVLHNWPDEACVKILRNIKNVMAPGGRIFTIDFGPLPEDGCPHISKLMDIHMATMLAGKERTISEYKKLCHEAGLELVNVETISISLCMLTLASVEE